MTDLPAQLRHEIRRTVALDILHHEAANELERLKADQQREIGALARYRIETQLVDQLLEEGPNTETTSLDMEYWNDQHDQLKAVLQERAGLREQVERLTRELAEEMEHTALLRAEQDAIQEQAVKNCDEVLALREERDALREDAARYRHLRDVDWKRGSLIFYAERYGPEDWDAEIDAARKDTP